MQFGKGSSQEISVNVVYLISNHLHSENYTTSSLGNYQAQQCILILLQHIKSSLTGLCL